MVYETEKIEKFVKEYGESYTYIDAVKQGLHYKRFESMATEMPFTNEEWSNYLHISERTLQRYNKEQKSFDVLQSERIIQILILFGLGYKVFGDIKKFNQWLSLSSIALGNKKPKDFLDTTFGIELLKDELHKIQHGILG